MRIRDGRGIPAKVYDELAIWSDNEM